MMMSRPLKGADLESIDILRCIKGLYTKKLVLLFAGIIVGVGVFVMGTARPARHQAIVSIRLNQSSADILAQNDGVTVVRSQDIRPDLKGNGLVKIFFHKQPKKPARVDIIGEGSDPRKAKSLTLEAAGVFVERLRGPEENKILGKPKSIGAARPESATRAVVAALAAVIIAAAMITIPEYRREPHENRPAPESMALPLTK